ncbi:MAG: ABC transporter ATP-binding protein [Chloroflexota bacterium]
MSLLTVDNLQVTYATRRGVVRAVDGVSFAVESGTIMGLIGESGCGKTTTGQALMRVMPKNARIVGGRVILQTNGAARDLLSLGESEMRQVRWRQLAMIPQASMHALDPVYKVGDQLIELLRERGGYKHEDARARARELFKLVGLDDNRLNYYPHEFSGGMRQRAVIAMALALNPPLVIADEPVTALDVIVQHQVLETLKELQQRLGLSVLLITHDMAVIAQVCDAVAVMYAGKIVERGSVAQIFHSPFHPYTLGLENCFPDVDAPRKTLVSIEGYPPELVAPPAGCRFASRCPFAIERCRAEAPVLQAVEEGHTVACHRADEVEMLRVRAKDEQTWQMVGSYDDLTSHVGT